MSASLPGFCFDGLKVSPVLDFSRFEIGESSDLVESDFGSGKIFMDEQLLCSAG
jgi:hypothetical protein